MTTLNSRPSCTRPLPPCSWIGKWWVFECPLDPLLAWLDSELYPKYFALGLWLLQQIWDKAHPRRERWSRSRSSGLGCRSGLVIDCLHSRERLRLLGGRRERRPGEGGGKAEYASQASHLFVFWSSVWRSSLDVFFPCLSC